MVGRRRLRRVDVDGRGLDLAALQPLSYGRFVKQLAARGVDEDDAVLHLGDGVSVDELGRGRIERSVEGDVVRLAQQFIHLDQHDAHLARRLFQGQRVKDEDVHAERLGPLGDQLADTAEADDAQHLISELDTDEVAAPPLASLQRAVGLGDVAADGQHEGHGQLGRGHAVGPGGVHNDNAAHRGRFDVDVVNADAGAPDDTQLFACGQHVGRDLRAAADD